MVEASAPPLAQTWVSSPVFSDKEIEQLARMHGTPVFIVDELTLHRRLAELEQAYSDHQGPLRIAYSIKANFSPAVIKVFISEAILFDVTSLGEMSFFLRCGGSPENVIYTSVTEEEQEFEEVLASGITHIATSSYNGLLNLIDAATRTQTHPKVLIRVNPEVGVKAEVRASYRHGKFGVPFNTGTEDSAANLLRKILATAILQLEGFHFHLGSQIEDPVCFTNALEKLENFILKMRKEFPALKVTVVDIGGGTPVFYGKPVPSPQLIAKLVTSRLKTMAERLGGPVTLIVESGRFLSAEACILISKVTNTKVYANQKFVFVDAGYHLLLDAALLHQEYPQEVVPRSQTSELSRVNLAGRLCDTYDIFPVSPASNLAGAEVGKYVVFHNVGAYSIVFNMPFHCQTKPSVIMRRAQGDYQLIRQSQTIEQLFDEEGGNLPFTARTQQLDVLAPPRG